MKCVLKCGRTLIGAIPPEGCPVRGARLVPSPSWFKNNTNINSEKIICREHLNFADQIIAELDKVLQRQSVVH